MSKTVHIEDNIQKQMIGLKSSHFSESIIKSHETVYYYLELDPLNSQWSLDK